MPSLADSYDALGSTPSLLARSLKNWKADGVSMIRLTWPGGASQWEHAAVHSANGYAQVTAIGTGPKPADRDVRVEVRLTDASGHVFARLAGPMGAPPSLVR